MSTMRVGGLASGMDIDAIVEKLMQAEKMPLNKLQQQQQKYEWERDAYREINTVLKSFDDLLFDGYRLSSNFYKKSVSSSNSSLVSATATSAATGSLSIEAVSQLASSARVVGNTINADSSTKLSELGITDSSSVTLNAIQANGKLLDKAVTISIDENETVESFIKKINNSNVGITAIFENNKISFTAKNTGNNVEGGEIIVDSGADVFNKLLNKTINGNILADNGKNAIFTINGISTEKSSNTFSLNGYNVTLHETFNSAQSLGDSFIAALENRNNSNSNYNEMLDKDIEGSLANKYSSFISDDPITAESLRTFFESESGGRQSAVENAKESLKNAQNTLILGDSFSPEEASTYNNLSKEVKDFIKDLDSGKLDSVANFSTGKTAEEQNLTQDEYDFLAGLSGDDTKVFDFTAQQLEEATTAKTVGQVYSSLSAEAKEFAKAHLTDSIDFDNLSIEEQEAFSKIDSADEQELIKNNFTEILSILEEQNTLDAAQSSLNDLNTDIQKFNSTVSAQLNNEEIYNTAKATLVSALLVGATPEQASVINSANDEDLKMLAENLSQNGASVAPVNLTSSTNVDDMVEKIKKFVETYNGLVTTINEKLKETKYRDYQPLTDEQREEMKEDQIEKWEEKAKSGLLRGDSILSNGLYSLRRTFSETINGLADSTIDSLAEIGITTSSNYSDGGKLVINEDKLRAAIDKNPDQVAQIFTKTGTKADPSKGIKDTRGLAQKLRDELGVFTKNIEKKAGKTTSTNQTFTIGKQIVDVEKRIDAWKNKLKDIEARYWRQFTAMEQAINKANQQSTLFMPQM